MSGADQELLHEFYRQDFHCAKDVFRNSGITDSKTLSACQGFLGGTLLTGMTCSALTATGIMAIGLKKGQIENSYVKVFRMIRMMDESDKWLGNDINNFHRSINLGKRLHAWSTNTYGGSTCRKICGNLLFQRRGRRKEVYRRRRHPAMQEHRPKRSAQS